MASRLGLFAESVRYLGTRAVLTFDIGLCCTIVPFTGTLTSSVRLLEEDANTP